MEVVKYRHAWLTYRHLLPYGRTRTRSTLQANTKEFFARLNESTQSLLILTVFDLLEVLQSLRSSRDTTKKTPDNFYMGAFATDCNRRYLVLTVSHNER